MPAQRMETPITVVEAVAFLAPAYAAGVGRKLLTTRGDGNILFSFTNRRCRVY